MMPIRNTPTSKRSRLRSPTSRLSFIGDNPDSRLLFTGPTVVYPRVKVTFWGGRRIPGIPIEIDVEEFIGVKSYRARGKSGSPNYEVEGVEELEPTRFPEPETRNRRNRHLLRVENRRG